MFVKCESWHGLEYKNAGNTIIDNLTSVFGVSNVFGVPGAAGGLTIASNFDNNQLGLQIGSNFHSPTGVRFGPGITGNHRFTSQSDWYVHFATNINDVGLITRGVLLWFEDLTVFPSEMRQCSFCIVDDGPSGFHFELRSGNGWNNFSDSASGVKSTVLASSSSQFKQAGVYYIQLHVNIGVSGASRLIISGIEEWNVSGINTRGATANSSVNAISFLSDQLSFSTFGNIVIADGRADGLTPSFNNLLGEFVVSKIQPNGNGDANDFNPVGAAQNWQTINEYQVNKSHDVDYNETSTSGNKDVVNYEDPNFILSGIVYGLDLRTSAKKTDAGTRSLRHIIKPSTVEYNGYTHPLISTYTHFTDCFDINQDTGVRYTDAELDAHQFGYELL